MSLLGKTHGKLVHSRRVERISEELSRLFSPNAQILDVGCGDGLIPKLIKSKRPDVEIQGIDVLVRGETHVPVTEFDGKTIPFPDKSFDAVMFVDVLHHTDDPMVMLREAVRVSRKNIILKDHTDNGFLSNFTLRFMDWIGNKPHGVVLPYNYWKKETWEIAIRELNLKTEFWEKDLKLYPNPADLIFGRSLHFVAKLKLADAQN
ncbi:MAG: class I SAM-dependent methyltransferase [Pyrinomonadaceae bacterium]